MLSNHIQATRDLEDAIRHLSTIIAQLPDDIKKFRLQARIDMLSETTQRYIAQSGNLYDELLNLRWEE